MLHFPPLHCEASLPHRHASCPSTSTALGRGAYVLTLGLVPEGSGDGQQGTCVLELDEEDRKLLVGCGEQAFHTFMLAWGAHVQLNASNAFGALEDFCSNKGKAHVGLFRAWTGWLLSDGPQGVPLVDEADKRFKPLSGHVDAGVGMMIPNGEAFVFFTLSLRVWACGCAGLHDDPSIRLNLSLNPCFYPHHQLNLSPNPCFYPHHQSSPVKQSSSIRLNLSPNQCFILITSQAQSSIRLNLSPNPQSGTRGAPTTLTAGASWRSSLWGQRWRGSTASASNGTA